MSNNKLERPASLSLLSTFLFLFFSLSSSLLYADTDRGDAPSDMTSIDADLTSTYGEASHTIDTAVYLGSLIDHDATTQSTGLDATGDDTDGSNDDDGVTFPMQSGVPLLNIEESNTISIEASQAGFLNAWIDWNQDGDWDDTGETIATNTPMVAGVNSLLVTPDGFSPHGATYARFRFTSTSVASPSPIGLLPDGEVEDYKISTALPTPENICVKVILNNSFEQPVTSNYMVIPEDQVYGWSTVANSPSSTYFNTYAYRNSIEIWSSGAGTGVVPYDGNQFAEVNAYAPGTLYQDVELEPGSVYRWSFAHRGRDGTDSLRLLMGPADALVEQGVYTTSDMDWVVYSGYYTVPAGQAITRFGFQAHSSASGADPSRGNFLDDIRIQAGCDFGDAPDSYGTSFVANGANHVVQYDGVYLGDNDADRDMDAQPSELADGDDTVETDDEDGLVALPTLLDSANSYSVDVTVNNTGVNPSTLAGWIDFDGNGTFDADEGVTLNVPPGTTNGLVTLNWASVPADIKAGDSYLRLRITPDSLASTDAKGMKYGGEVEDYQVVIEPDDDDDGISNRDDIDDDNDGITDADESYSCVPAGANYIGPDYFSNVMLTNVSPETVYVASQQPLEDYWIDGDITTGRNSFTWTDQTQPVRLEFELHAPVNADGFSVANDYGKVGSGDGIREAVVYLYNDADGLVGTESFPSLLNNSSTGIDNYNLSRRYEGVSRFVIEMPWTGEGTGPSAPAFQLREVGLYTSRETCLSLDSDEDGIIDSLDLDSDNDGIPDNIEAQRTIGYEVPVTTDSDGNGLYDIYETSPGSGEGLTPVDTDDDGTIDKLDLDSDGDGVKDLVESGLFSDPATVDANNDGRTDNPVGVDGWDNTLYPADNYNDPNGNLDNPSADLTDEDGDVAGDEPMVRDLDYRDADNDIDRDGIPSSIDIDDDNDGILDADESYSCVPAGANYIGPDYFSNVMLTNVSPERIYVTSQQPLEDYWIDGDITTGRNSFTWTDQTQPVRLEFELHAPVNADGFSVANDYGKVGSGDGIREAVVYLYNDADELVGTESFPSLLNNSSTGIDNYDLSRRYEGISRFVIEMPWTGPGTGPSAPAFQLREVGLFTSRETCLSLDSDEDGIIDSLDLDSDNDGIPDNIEAQRTIGYEVPVTMDSDGNGLYDIYETSPGSGEGLTPVDTDGDGTIDKLDLDSDNDGVFDLVESGLIVVDANLDGKTDSVVGVNGWDDTLDTTDDYSDPNGDLDTPTTDLKDTDGDVAEDEPLTHDLDYRDAVINVDSDGDGLYDEDDIDDDNDGITDVTECAQTATYVDFSITDDLNAFNTTYSKLDQAGTSVSITINAPAATTSINGDYLRMSVRNNTFSKVTFSTNVPITAFESEDRYDVDDDVDPEALLTCALSSAGQNEGEVIGMNVPGTYTHLNGQVVDPLSSLIAPHPRTFFDDESVTEVVSADPETLVCVGNNDNIENGPTVQERMTYEFEQPTSQFSLIGSNNAAGTTVSAIMFEGYLRFYTSNCGDSDGDGVADSLDLDSDNDGIPDNIEAQTSADYIAPSATPTDNNSNGLDDIYETGDFSEGEGLTPVDTDGGTSDGDGTESLPDYLDLDSDDDDLTDLEESGLGLVDANKDGKTDGTVGLNGWDDNLEEAANKDNYADVNGKIDDPRSGTISLTDLDDDVSGAAPMTEDLDYRDTDVVLGYTVSGYVYTDTNVSGTQDAGDSGLAGVTIVLHNTDTGACVSTPSAADGQYRFTTVQAGNYTLYEAARETYPIPEQCPPVEVDPAGYRSTTPNIGTITMAEADISGPNFGDIGGGTFEPDHSDSLLAGSVVNYAHQFTPQADGTLSITASGSGATGWSEVIYLDADCDGTAEGIAPASIPVVAGVAQCLVNRVFAPTTAVSPERYTTTLTATLDSGNAIAGDIVLTVQDITRVIENTAEGYSKLDLTKTVENTTQGTGETQTRNEALPGDTLKYCIYYNNLGTGPLTDLVINDAVPAYTQLNTGTVTCDTTPPGVTCTPAENGDLLEWTFDAAIQGGEGGFVSYSVTVD